MEHELGGVPTRRTMKNRLLLSPTANIIAFEPVFPADGDVTCGEQVYHCELRNINCKGVAVRDCLKVVDTFW